MNPILTAQAAAQLQEGINLLLSRWAALRMAIENEWGGRDSVQKSHQMSDELFARLTQTREQVYMDDLEDILVQSMLSLNTEIDDGSVEEIAEKLMYMREECLEGNFESINRLRQTNIPNVSYTRQHGTNDDDDSEDDDEMEVDASHDGPNPNPERAMNVEPSPEVPEPAVDGWTVVSSKRRNGRRN